ncbi:MAG: hypothetical protein CVU40_10560 [Chloroflexi bacterium HGW-Chloroflexi-2]|jgi:hypothetical protein|nr:MAG: hypothetical protein CVU40_10560 [Chloroflexi bacterium HGW-Chloroflexi-2]
MKDQIKKILPMPVLTVVRDSLDAIKRSKEIPEAFFHSWRVTSRKDLEQFRNIHQGKRCFILGNGPSLKQTDLTKLKNEYTFGMNRIYLAFDDIGFETSYYVSVNDLVIEQCANEILELKIPRFVSWRAGKRWLTQQENLFFLYTTYTEPKFAKDIRNRLWESATVTYVALQIAFFMGFDEVILIGVDHNFETKGKANTTIISQGDDPNHFHPGYFGKGFRWQLPDLEMSEVGYRMAKEAFERDGRKVLDATIGGKLSIFEKIDYNRLF